MEGNWIFCLTNVYIIAFDFFLILALFETQNATKVTYIWPYFVCPEPVLGFFASKKCLHYLRPHLPKWDLPPGPVAQSRSADRWSLPGTAESVLCSLSSLLRIHHCKDNRNRGQWKPCCTPANVPLSVSKGTAVSVPLLLAQVGRGH